MALNVFLCLTRTGRATEEDKFEITLKDGTVLIGGTTVIEPYPDVGFCLHKDHWPSEVLEARDKLHTQFETSCSRPFQLSNVTAVINGSSKSGGLSTLKLTPGSLLTVVLRYWHWDTVEIVVKFDSPIVDLQPC